jgi:hypothetical protein
MKTSKLFKAFGLATAVTISSFGMWLVNQVSASAVNITPGDWCVHAGSYIVFGDFDGDNRKDALCADTQGGKWINYGNGGRWFTRSSWCTHQGARIYAAFLNSDKNQDLECIDSQNRVARITATKSGKFRF